jgi:hypothetical protein
VTDCQSKCLFHFLSHSAIDMNEFLCGARMKTIKVSSVDNHSFIFFFFFDIVRTIKSFRHVENFFMVWLRAHFTYLQFLSDLQTLMDFLPFINYKLFLISSQKFTTPALFTPYTFLSKTTASVCLFTFP